MSQHPQTIQIYLPKGNPRGLRIAEIINRTVRLFEVPRPLLADFFKLDESTQVGVYFLIKESEEEGTLPRLYIGQTGTLTARLKEHDSKKDFDRALVMVSSTNSMTQTHTLFLESLAIKAAKEVGRYTLENSNAGTRPHTPAPLKAECLELHETTALLLTTLGQRIFEATTQDTRAEGVSTPAEQSEAFYLRQPQHSVEAKAVYTTDEFVVLEGSAIRSNSVASFEGTGAARVRQRLIEEGILAAGEDGIYRFTRDYSFKSPSGASDVILGRSTNGWQEWRNEAGKTLDELKRQGA